MNTTAIVCIARNETPFMEEWLEYHFTIGIDRIYVISTDDDFPRLEAFFDGCNYRSGVELFSFTSFKPGWQIKCYNEFLPLVKEDWVLVIDIDEFLYLNAFPTITDVLEALDSGVGQVQFPWLNLMSGGYSHNRMADILNHAELYVSDHVKSMARRRYLSRLGVHSHGIDRSKNCLSSGLHLPLGPKHAFLLDDVGYFNNHPFILHFCSRGHFDVLNRIVDHQFFNAKNGPVEKNRVSRYLLNKASWSTIPTRYLLMKFYSSLPKADVQCLLPEMESRTDVERLKTTFLTNMKQIVDFDGGDLETVAARFETCYQLDQKLCAQKIPGRCDLQAYLKCSTQLDYVTQLRKSLERTEKGI
jgi:hypothetical protein